MGPVNMDGRLWPQVMQKKAHIDSKLINSLKSCDAMGLEVLVEVR